MRQVDLDAVLTEVAQHGAPIDTICIQFPVSHPSRLSASGWLLLLLRAHAVGEQDHPPRE